MIHTTSYNLISKTLVLHIYIEIAVCFIQIKKTKMHILGIYSKLSYLKCVSVSMYACKDIFRISLQLIKY